jgi:hypothetical protein
MRTHARKPGPSIAFAFCCTAAVGCAGSGHAKVQLTPATGLARAIISGEQTNADVQLTPIPAEQFELKILSAYLTEDVGPAMENTGRSERIWVNPGCPSADACRDSDVDYFDLSDPEEANRQLNSQGLAIAPGSYRYVRVEFCIGGARGNIVRYKSAAMPAAVEATYGGCAVTSERLEPAVEITDGSTVTIALEYDLTQQPLYYAVGSDTCGSLDSLTPCLGGVTLTPKVVR